jgi:hypothetical protein
MPDRCPLFPQKRTLELNREMSALFQKQTFCAAEDIQVPTMAIRDCCRSTSVRHAFEFPD